MGFEYNPGPRSKYGTVVLRGMKPLFVATLIAIIVGAVIGAVLLYIGFQHNPQGEFYDSESSVVKYWYSIYTFFFNFSFVFLVIFVPSVVIWAFINIKDLLNRKLGPR